MTDADLDDLRVNNLERPYDPNREPLPATWTPEHVGRRLVDAFGIQDRLPRVGGPKAPGGHWPQYSYDQADRNGWKEQRADREAEQNQTRVPPTAIEIGRMETAFDWLRLLRAHDTGQSYTLMLWASQTAQHRTIKDLCLRKKWSFRNFYRRVAKAKMWIADHLNSTSFPVY